MDRQETGPFFRKQIAERDLPRINGVEDIVIGAKILLESLIG